MLLSQQMARLNEKVAILLDELRESRRELAETKRELKLYPQGTKEVFNLQRHDTQNTGAIAEPIA